MTSVAFYDHTIPDDAPCRCDNCGAAWRFEQLTVIQDFGQRVEPGNICPAGECPDGDCGALCYLVLSDKPRFRNHYKCPECSTTWADEWDAACDDDCPECGQRHITPYKSDDI